MVPKCSGDILGHSPVSAPDPSLFRRTRADAGTTQRWRTARQNGFAGPRPATDGAGRQLRPSRSIRSIQSPSNRKRPKCHVWTAGMREGTLRKAASGPPQGGPQCGSGGSKRSCGSSKNRFSPASQSRAWPKHTAFGRARSSSGGAHTKKAVWTAMRTRQACSVRLRCSLKASTGALPRRTTAPQLVVRRPYGGGYAEVCGRYASLLKLCRSGLDDLEPFAGRRGIVGYLGAWVYDDPGG
jgi:hypothetical protein